MQCQCVFDSPLGPLTAIEDDGVLVALRYGCLGINTDTVLLQKVKSQVCNYFLGTRRTFNLPLKPHGTNLQKLIWSAVLEIPFGCTLPYKGIANKLKISPRTVGIACARNPIPILIPCHRIIASNGSLGGYSHHEGMKTKKYLLLFENVL